MVVKKEISFCLILESAVIPITLRGKETKICFQKFRNRKILFTSKYSSCIC